MKVSTMATSKKRMPVQKAKKAPNQKIAVKTAPAVDWFVLRCSRRDDKTVNGFLAIDKDFRSSSKQVYSIVEDSSNAMRFPSTNVYNTDGFGTPKQWLEFFKGENELSDWKFHLVKIGKQC